MQLAQTDARLAKTEQELSMQRREARAMRLERSAWQECEATLLTESAQAEHVRSLHDDLEVRLAEAGVQLSHMESELAQERLVAQEDESADGRRRLQKREENQDALDLERDVWRVSEMQATEEIRASLQDIEQKLAVSQCELEIEKTSKRALRGHLAAASRAEHVTDRKIWFALWKQLTKQVLTHWNLKMMDFAFNFWSSVVQKRMRHQIGE